MKRILVGIGLVLAGGGVAAQEGDAQKRLCMLDKMKPENAAMTIGDVLKACETPPEEPLVVERGKLEVASFDNPYSIAPHRPNYFLGAVFSSRSPTTPPFELANDGAGRVAKLEGEFQISLKTPVILGRESGIHWMLAYTNRSFWQVYNGDWSRPFRETNHEPETWVQFPLQWRIPGTAMHLRGATLGINHQSNGQTGEWSRSWNRLMGSLILDNGGRFALGVRPWIRIAENGRDDNPDIVHYMGNFELLGTYRFTQRHQLTFMLRDNLERRDNKGAIEIAYGFPLPGTPDLRFYVQAFHGYGKSLIDYKLNQTSLGVGLQLVDW